MKTALLTGSTGFMGSFLQPRLIENGYKVTSLDSKNCDLTHPESLKKYSGEKYDLIIHLAAWTQAGDFCLKHPGEQWLINQKINTHMLDWWLANQKQARLVAIGTSCAYPEGSDMTEDRYMAGEPTESLFTYAMTKRMLYQGLRALHAQYGMKYLYLVPSTLYGPGYHLDGRQMHFIFDLIRKIIRGKELGEKVVLWGDGYQKREIIHVDDYARLFLGLLTKATNDIYNIASGEEFSIREFAEKICAITGYDFQAIEFDLSRYVGARSKSLSMKKTIEKLGPLNVMPLEKGLKQTIDWMYSSGAWKL